MSELKHCPFCNQELLSKDLGDGEIEFYHNMDCCIPPITTIMPTEYIKDWNSAWCWKEIEKLKEQIMVYEERKSDVKKLYATLSNTRAENERLRGALKEVLRYKDDYLFESTKVYLTNVVIEALREK